MNFHGKDIKIFTGSSNVDVAQGIAGCLGLPLGKSDCTQFSDGEISVSLLNLFVAATALLFSQPVLPSTTILWKCS